MNLKPLLSGLGIFSVLGTGSLGGAYLTTKETVSEGLKKSGITILPKDESQNSRWDYLFRRLVFLFKKEMYDGSSLSVSPLGLSESQKKKFNAILRSIFGDLLDKKMSFSEMYSTPSEDNKKGIEKLKNFCSGASSSTYKTIFSEDGELLENFKSFCSVKNNELLDVSSVSTMLLSFSNSEDAQVKEDFQKNLEDLNSSGPNEKQDAKLASLKAKYKVKEDKDNLWKELAEWCKSSVNSYYSGDENILLSIQKYCSRSY